MLARLRAYCGDADKLRTLWQDIYLTRLSGADKETRTLLDDSVGRPKAHSIARLAQSMSGGAGVAGTTSTIGASSPILSRARAGSGGGRDVHHRRAFSDPDLDLFSLVNGTTNASSTALAPSAPGDSRASVSDPPRPATVDGDADGDDATGDGGGGGDRRGGDEGGSGDDSAASEEVLAYARALLEASDGQRPSPNSVRRAVAHKFGADTCYEARSALRKLAADADSAPSSK